MTTTAENANRHTDGPVHKWFGLSYSNYQVLPRTLMQSMPIDWQHRMVGCLQELRAAFAHIDEADGYDVTPGRWVHFSECNDAELALAGVTTYAVDPDGVTIPDETLNDDDVADTAELRYGWRGEEYQGHDYVFIPGDDPVPGYNRGRTYVEPKLPDTTSRPDAEPLTVDKVLDALLRCEDGSYLGDDDDIPAGEIRRILAETLRSTSDPGAVTRKPSDLWQAVLCDAYGRVIDVDTGRYADDPFLWIVRRSAAPRPAGAAQRMPYNGSYDEADVAHRMTGFLAHRETIPARFAEAQAMVAGLNAAEADR